MIRIERLCASYGHFKLRNVSLDVAAGECCVIIGPSGAGKSMLLETVLGLKKPEAGRIMLDGRDITHLPPEDRHVAYIPQDVALFPHLSVRDNILFGRRMRKTLHDSDADLARLATMLEIDHLLARRSITTLSGGERQRVALARALITHPRVLFLDESFAALDNHIRTQILTQFRELQRTLALTVIAVTHSHQQASILADKLAVMITGGLVQTAPVDELFARPANRAVARLLALRNIYDINAIERNGQGAYCQIGDVRVVASDASAATGHRLCAWLPPDEIIVQQLGQPSVVAEPVNRYEAIVDSFRRDGLQRYARLTLGNGRGPYIDCPLSRRMIRTGQPAAGEVVEVIIPCAAVTLFPEQ